MISLSQIEYLIALAEEKHFGRAAKKCFVSQPSLSVQIQNLEEELDCIIFDRSKKPILITQVGEAVLQQARSILKEHKKLSFIAQSQKNTLSGEFRLAVIPTLSPYLIPLFLNDFVKTYPDIQLKIQESKTEEITQLLKNDAIDAGLLVTPLYDEQLIENHLFFEPFYAFLSQDHRLQNNKLITEKDLDPADLWLLNDGHCFKDQVLKVCQTKKVNHNGRNFEFSSGNLETLKNIVKQNQGYTLLPELALRGLSKKEYAKHVREFKKPVPTRQVSLVYSRSFYKEAYLKALEKSIIESLPESIQSLKRKSLNIIDI